MPKDATILQRWRKLAKVKNARILFPEETDPRVIDAIQNLRDEGFCQPILMEPPKSNPNRFEVFSEHPDKANWLELAKTSLIETQRKKNLTSIQAKAALENPIILAASLVKVGYVDAGVVGCMTTTADVLRAGIKAIGVLPGSGLVSSAFLIQHGMKTFTFADCAVNVQPTPVQLAQIAIDSAHTHQLLTGEIPFVGLLSFSTNGSAKHHEIDTVREALALVKQRRPELIIDGELQFDTAYIPEIAEQKFPNSAVAGRCNVFIFPNLAAGNIGYKIAERMAGARAIGPVLQGLESPWLDLSRGCSTRDIIETAILASILAK